MSQTIENSIFIGKWALRGWFFTLFFLIAGSGWYIYKANNIYYKDLDETNKKIQTAAWGLRASSENGSGFVNFDRLKIKYPDMYAWIYQKNSDINYPIMYRKGDNSYYLNHNCFNDKMVGGSIYFNGYGNPDFSDRNTIIYGIDTKNDKMFSSLRLYVYDRDYSREHSTFYIINGSEKIYAVVAAYEDSTQNEIPISFINNESYMNFLKNALESTLYVPPQSFDIRKPSLTLVSRCQSGEEKKRYIVILQPV